MVGYADEKTRVTKAAKLTDKMQNADSCLIQIYGKEMGRKFTLGSSETTIGRGADSGIVCDMDNVSRTHAKIFGSEGAFFIKDLNSTNGTFVNDAEIRQEKLRNGDLIKIGGTIFKFLSGGNIEALYHEEIYQMTIVDGLTMINNKRFLLEFLEREMARSGRSGRDLCIIMFDLDHFKRVNDEFGHLAGDYVLKRVCSEVSRLIRKEECFARYGGEEFVIVLPETNMKKAAFLAEKIRELIERTRFQFENNNIPITLSMGLASMDERLKNASDFIKVADDKLYQAKGEGRNCVRY